MPNLLEQLKQYTTVVADTGDFNQLKQYQPQDATTNPSLILKAVQKEVYRPLLLQTVQELHHAPLETKMDELIVRFGGEILKVIPGRVSTEVDARLSFDTDGMINKARHLIALYEKAGYARERVLIKLATTWEGVQAAKQLQREKINCNMTLLFSLTQAIACAQVGAQLISPFVGRITDWYKKNENKNYTAAEDPGVQSVQRIYHYYKKFAFTTEIMGASFRNIGQIQELAGCDLLTISPELLEQLQSTEEVLQPKLSPQQASEQNIERISTLDEKTFRYQINQDAMATEKLAEGIRAFVQDAAKLEKIITAEI